MIKKIDKKANVVFAELDINAIVSVEDKGIKYRETSKFPSIDVDLTFISDKYAPIRDAIEAADSELIRNISVLGTYIDPVYGKSITVRLSFVHPERTLTKDEVMDIANGIIERLEKQGIALKQ